MPEDPRALLQKADKLLAGASGFWSFFNGEDNQEEAVTLLHEAARIYSGQGNYAEAAKALEKKARVTMKMNKEDVSGFVEAMSAYAQVPDPKAAERCFNFLKEKKEYMIRPMAKMYEEKVGDMEKASEYYAMIVAVLFAQPLNQKKWLEKQADTAALHFAKNNVKDTRDQPCEAHLKTALKIYSDIAQSLFQGGADALVPAVVLKIAICGLAQLEEQLLNRTLDNVDPVLRIRFEGVSQGTFFAQLRDTWITNNLEGFARVMVWTELNNTGVKLEAWHIAMLLNVGRKTWGDAKMDQEREKQKQLYLAGEWKKLQDQRVQEPQSRDSYQTQQPYSTQHQRPQHQDSYPTQHQRPQYQEPYQPQAPSPAPQPKSNQPAEHGTHSAKQGDPDAEEFF